MSEIDKVWDLLPLKPGEYHHVWARGEGKPDFALCLRSKRGLERFRKWTTVQKMNAYIGCNPLKHAVNFRAKAHDVSRIATIFLDIDPIPDLCGEPVFFAGELLEKLAAEGFCRQEISMIDSGRGIQLWISMDVPLEGHDKVRALVHHLAESMGERFACKLDTSVTDLPRVMRLPGTVNQKTGRPATVVRAATETVSAESWEHAPMHEMPKSQVPEISSQRLDVILCSIPAIAVDFILIGVELDRHKACYTTMKSLSEAGVPADAALQLTLKGAALSSLDPGHVYHTHEQVYG